MGEQKAENERVRRVGIEVVGVLQLRTELLRSNAAGVQKNLLLNLGETLDLKIDVPGGQNITAAVSSEEQQQGLGYTRWVGAARDVADSLITFVYDGGVVVGSIRVKGTVLKISPAIGRKDLHVVEKVNSRDYPDEAHPVEPSEGRMLEKKSELDASPQDMVRQCAADQSMKTARVLLLYTERAERQAGSAAILKAIVEDFVGQGNIALRISGIRLRIERAGSPIKLAPPVIRPAIVGDARRPAQPADKLRALQKYLGNLAERTDIAALKRRHGAQLVTLLDPLQSDFDACGIGFVMRSTANRNTGYNIVDFRCAWDNYSFIHEIGHNLGAGHSKDSEANVPLHLFDYSFGLRWPGKFRTIMAYNCAPATPCERIDRFTNPRIGYNDVMSIGDVASADNARTLNETRCFFTD
jgi:peptidyl-Asp metalloendopeptidase